MERQLGSPESAQNTFDYIQRLDLGFKLLNVTVRTHRVLSLIASVVIGVLFAFGSSFIDASSFAAGRDL